MTLSIWNREFQNVLNGTKLILDDQGTQTSLGSFEIIHFLQMSSISQTSNMSVTFYCHLVCINNWLQYAYCLEPLALLLDNSGGLLLTAYYFSFFGVFFQIKHSRKLNLVLKCSHHGNNCFLSQSVIINFYTYTYSKLLFQT